MPKCPHCDRNIDVRFIKAPDSTKPSKASHSGSDLGSLLDAIDGLSLSGASKEFFDSMQEKYEQFGDETFVSDKQQLWLERLAEGK